MCSKTDWYSQLSMPCGIRTKT